MPRPNVFLLVTMLFWGFNFVSLKIAYTQVPPGAVLFSRFWVAWLLLSLLCLIKRESIVPPDHLRARVWFGGFLSMGVYMVLFLEGTSRTSPAIAAILLGTAPIITGVLSNLLGMERFSLTRIIGGLIAFLGVSLVILGRGIPLQGEIVGDLLVFCAAIAWSISILIMRPAMSEVKSLPLLTQSFAGAIPVVFLYGLQPTLATSWSALRPEVWLNLLQIGLLSGGVSFIFYYKGIDTLGPSRATFYQYLVPPITVFFASVVLHEKLQLIQGIGLGILIVGLFLATRIDAEQVKSWFQNRFPRPS